MKNKQPHQRPHRSIGLLGALGMLATLAAPATVTATPDVRELDPTAAAADPCEKSTVQLEIDVATGLVYLVDPVTGNLELTDNDINIHFGSLGHVVVVLHYTSSNWAVSITPDNGAPVTYRTTNGWLRYTITDDVDMYRFSSTWLSSMAAMSSMTPVVPDVIIRPDKDCPPPT